MARPYTHVQVVEKEKWVTDISYIHTAQGVLYLCIIRDLFDNSMSPTKPEPISLWALYSTPFVMLCEKRRPLGSCSFTATKAFNTPLMHISA